MIIKLSNKEHVSSITLSNVYYYPHIHFTLISEETLCIEDRCSINKIDNKCIIYNNIDMQIDEIIATNKLYVIISHFPTQHRANMISLQKLHEKLDHLNFPYLRWLLKENPKLVNDKVIDNDEKICSKCLEANISCTTIFKYKESELSKNFNNHLHIDIWGPSPTIAYDDIKYLLIIVDDATRWVEMISLKLKSDAYTKYIKYTTCLFTNFDIKIKMLQSNNDTIFLSQDFTNYLDN